MGYWINFDRTGIRIHRDTCRHAQDRDEKKKEGRWEWAATQEEVAEKVGSRLARNCKVCLG